MEKNSPTKDEGKENPDMLSKPGCKVRGVLGKKLKKFLMNFLKHLFCVFKGREYLVENQSFTFPLGDRYST